MVDLSTLTLTQIYADRRDGAVQAAEQNVRGCLGVGGERDDFSFITPVTMNQNKILNETQQRTQFY